MGKITRLSFSLVIVICLFTSFFVPVSHADLFRQMPGVSCGVGGTAQSKCCTYDKTPIFRVPKAIEWIPGIIGSLARSYNDKADQIEQIQKDLNGDPCLYGTPSGTGPSCQCIATATSSAILALTQMCSTYLRSGTERAKCIECNLSKGGLYSGIGCLPLNVQQFISEYVFKIGLGIAGGISLLCIIYSAIRMQSSMGNAEVIKKAQENLTACITGLVLIIFSVFILRLIGVNILRIPFLQ